MPFDLLEAARRLIATDTVSARGNAAIVEPLRGYGAQVGLVTEVFRQTVYGADQANLLFVPPGNPDSGEPLLLVTHTDTVDPGPLEAWTETPPLTPKLDGDRLYGLGSADVKVDLLCKLLALERLGDRQLRRPVFVLGTFGEEIGLLGAKHFVESGRVRARFVVCGEPSELTLIHAHKGYLVARVRLGQATGTGGPNRRVASEVYTGRSAHSSTPALGDNAILKALAAPLAGAVAIRGGQGANSVPAHCTVERVAAAEVGAGPELPLGEARALIARFEALAAGLQPHHDARFSPATAVTNVGWIEGRDGELEFLLDCRILPGQSPEALAAAFAPEVQAAGGIVVFERQNPAVYTDPQGELCQAAVRVSHGLTLDPTLRTKATNTEAAAFVPAAGSGAPAVEALVFGPGPSVGNAHCPNEHTYVSHLFTAVDWYEGLIRTLAT